MLILGDFVGLQIVEFSPILKMTLLTKTSENKFWFITPNMPLD